MPGKNRTSPGEALLFLRDVLDRLTIVTLDESEYWRAIETTASAGTSGGALYDALIGQCALKANAQTLYTWNIKHFQLLGAEIAARTKEPG